MPTRNPRQHSPWPWPGLSAYLLDDGHLLRSGRPASPFFGGLGGLIEKLDWHGNVVASFLYSNDQHCQHHDIEPLPNGNVLLIAWEQRSWTEAVDAGRDPATVNMEFGF